MITVTRERRIARPAEDIQALLADPRNLPRVLPRITSVEVGQSDGGRTALTAHFNFGAQLGQREAVGWFTATSVEAAFESSKPLPILARWTIIPAGEVTLLKALLQFNLKPLLGPLALLLPAATVKKTVSDELDAALLRVERLAAPAT